MPRDEKKLKKLLRFKEAPDLAHYEQLMEVNDRLESLQEELKKKEEVEIDPATREALKGDPGEDGRDGIDGLDGQDGIDGTDGVDGKDGKQGPRGDRGPAGPPGKDGRDGIDGKDGTDASVDEEQLIENVIEAIKKLKGNKRIDISSIRNAPLPGNRKKIDFSDMRWHGGGIVDFAGLRINIKTVTTNYTVTTDDDVIKVNAVSGPVTITLPDAGFVTKRFTIKKIDSNFNNSVIIKGPGSQTVDGAANQTIKIQYTSVDIVSDQSNYFII